MVMPTHRRPNVPAMPVIGLTGGIASGKSTVAARWRERGARVIDADAVAREIVEPGEPALAAIAERFGTEMIRDDGTLDRSKLGALVFSDREALGRLNAITHPAIMARVGRHLLTARSAGEPWVAYEAALIIENGLAPGLSRLFVVLCDPEVQVTRLMARNGLDEEAARARLAAQTTNEQRINFADVLIQNTGTLAELQAAADAHYDALCQEHGLPTGDPAFEPADA